MGNPAFTDSQRAPEPAALRIWLGPVARSQCEQLLRAQLERAHVCPVPGKDEALTGPAVLVLDADDLTGPQRHALRRLLPKALPGRPIILGGGASKSTLLDAINNWNAIQLIRRPAVRSTLADAVRDAYQNLVIEQGVLRAAEALRDECARLDAATNELQLTQERLLHAERLASVGRMVGTLLTRMRDEQFSDLERLRRSRSNEELDQPLRELLDCSVGGIDSFGALLEDMLALSENEAVSCQMEEIEIDELVSLSLRLFQFDSLGRQRRLVREGSGAVRVRVDRYRMCHVLLNLLRNAAQATAEGQSITLRSGTVDQRAFVEVIDHGPGMAPSVLEQLFTPFFTTKGKAGMGLGLRLAKTTVERHDGTLTCYSEPGQGARFRIELPLDSSR